MTDVTYELSMKNKFLLFLSYKACKLTKKKKKKKKKFNIKTKIIINDIKNVN